MKKLFIKYIFILPAIVVSFGLPITVLSTTIGDSTNAEVDNISPDIIMDYSSPYPLRFLFECPAPAVMRTLGGLIACITQSVLNPLIGLLLVLALVVFFWGMVKYIKSEDGGEDKAAGRNLMIWGIVALFVMVSVWGLVDILIKTFFSGGLPSGPPVPAGPRDPLLPGLPRSW